MNISGLMKPIKPEIVKSINQKLNTDKEKKVKGLIRLLGVMKYLAQSEHRKPTRKEKMDARKILTEISELQDAIASEKMWDEIRDKRAHEGLSYH